MIEIIIVANGYPDRISSTTNVFVKELRDEWVRQGHKVSVICPVTIIRYFQILIKGKDKDCYYPLYFELSALKKLSFLRSIAQRIDDISFLRAVKRNIAKNKNAILYAHFLNAGLAVAEIAGRTGMKAFCAVGESTLWSLRYRNMDYVRSVLKNINGFISVSTSNKEMLITNNIAEEDRIIVIPNAVDTAVFRKKDKKACRKKLGLPLDRCIGIFVGHFNERKGVLRVSEACSEIRDLDMIYIGHGDQRPMKGNIAFVGEVEHKEIADYLNAADFFILPTLAEGCCNAIIEAISCGLPVISSSDTFNDDILSNNYSIRVNPRDVIAIKNAIESLVYDKKKLLDMSCEAAKIGSEYDIRKRAKIISEYLEA